MRYRKSSVAHGNFHYQKKFKTILKEFLMTAAIAPYKTMNKVRFVTATSLFDGHDATINVIRRILLASGAEVIHLGHNRSVEEIVTAAIQEDAQGIAVSCYQGGHIEFFKYIIDLLDERGEGHIKVYGGGGGVIVPDEIAEIEAYGVRKIFSPEDGRRLGLQGMINVLLEECDYSIERDTEEQITRLARQDVRAVNTLISLAEQDVHDHTSGYGSLRKRIQELGRDVPVVGITGTGGAGKSSLTDELVRRFTIDFPEKSVAILAVDPSRQRTGGALLGDRIRMNAINSKNVYMRSLATRNSQTELSAAIQDAIDVVRAAGYDLVIVETSGIGQGNAGVVNICDVALYVMTSEFGAPTQLEKIDMLDFADLVAINKFERKGAEDALRNVRKQYQRNRNLMEVAAEELPVFGTIASQFNDPGTNTLYRALIDTVNRKKGSDWNSSCVVDESNSDSLSRYIIPADNVHYLGEIVHTVRNYHAKVKVQSGIARRMFQLEGAREVFSSESTHMEIDKKLAAFESELTPESKRILNEWSAMKDAYRRDQLVTVVRGREIRSDLYTISLSGIRIPKVCLPGFADFGEILRWCMLENAPGYFPFTAGVFPFKRTEEDPKRQFAGEGSPDRTNRRFHYLSKEDDAKRLSTAFDSVTLYGENPDFPPDIYGKVGESGVSICTVDDMKRLYAGFDLCAPNTSVSITINGPAPIMLAFFFCAAIDQQVDRFREANGRKPSSEEYLHIRDCTLQTVRGTVQADILKEDQGQNTCIFSTEFALRMMGDIQQYFIDKMVRNYYSVSISGYHIAEAGANPVSQLAFTLSNGFTYVEYYLSRGMHIDDFAPNLSFFFSNGLDPEYSVIGRVARRIWAVAMRDKYGANERSQKLKYHIQTSGRSLHAQEMDFNDIRTTLQALMAIYDNCNSLHTNAYDEAVTTPSEDSVRRAMAIQMIINREFGLARNENPLQGSFIIEELTNLVEEAVLAEFERIDHRGGVLGAMETQYQRAKIQDESMLYEHKKHSGELPIIGVNTFLHPRSDEKGYQAPGELARATKEEKLQQIENLRVFHEANREAAQVALRRLKDVAVSGGNIFAELMDTVRVASLGQITHSLYEVGGKYRRNM